MGSILIRSLPISAANCQNFAMVGADRMSCCGSASRDSLTSLLG